MHSAKTQATVETVERLLSRLMFVRETHSEVPFPCIRGYRLINDSGILLLQLL